MSTPQAVKDVLNKLDPADQDVVLAYIDELQSELKAFQGSSTTTTEKDIPMDAADDEATNGEPPFPPLYQSGEDFDKAGDLKQEAAELVSNGDYEAALEKYTEAILAAPPSALLYANRATALLKLGRPKAAERDCDCALNENPDSAKALRVRGKARKELGKWEEALKDLSASQQIDFDEGTVEVLKFLSEKRIEAELAEAEVRNKEKDRLRKRAEEIKKAQEDAKKNNRGFGDYDDDDDDDDEMPDLEATGGMPAGGMPGGMGGMPGMEGMMGALMSDPELMAEMQNPKVQQAFQELMSGPGGPMGLLTNPAKLQELMADPEVGPVIQKLMSKLGGGFMPGAGAAGGMPTTTEGGNDDDIPNLDDLNDGDGIDISKVD